MPPLVLLALVLVVLVVLVEEPELEAVAVWLEDVNSAPWSF
jgi:hypothetical protein